MIRRIRASILWRLSRLANLPKLVDQYRDRLFIALLVRRGDVLLGERVVVARGSRIGTGVTIGTGTAINGPCVLKGADPIRIGNYCAIGDGVRMISSNHATTHLNLQYRLQARLGFSNIVARKGPLTVGHSVWIGDMAIILGGVTVGNGAVIGAGAVVTKDVEPYSVVAGVPARSIGTRFPQEEIDRIEALAWWEWTEEEMRSRPDLFSAPLVGEQSE